MGIDLTPMQDELNRRLRRIEGQVRGVQKMVEEGRSPSAILQQLSAISSAVHGVGLRLLLEHYTISLNDADPLPPHERQQRLEEFGNLLERIP